LPAGPPTSWSGGDKGFTAEEAEAAAEVVSAFEQKTGIKRMLVGFYTMAGIAALIVVFVISSDDPLPAPSCSPSF
jgi:hypothetical protein